MIATTYIITFAGNGARKTNAKKKPTRAKTNERNTIQLRVVGFLGRKTRSFPFM